MTTDETRFWQIRNEPYADEVRYVDGWYWQDAACAEPMGPFSTKAEAEADHCTLRKTSALAALIANGEIVAGGIIAEFSNGRDAAEFARLKGGGDLYTVTPGINLLYAVRPWIRRAVRS